MGEKKRQEAFQILRELIEDLKTCEGEERREDHTQVLETFAFVCERIFEVCSYQEENIGYLRREFEKLGKAFNESVQTANKNFSDIREEVTNLEAVSLFAHIEAKNVSRWSRGQQLLGDEEQRALAELYNIDYDGMVGHIRQLSTTEMVMG